MENSSRIIKFRAWDKLKKRMFLVKELTFRLDYREELNGPIDYVTVYGDGDEVLVEYTLMQAVGLKDICGKEIYEGDILEVQDMGFGYKYIGVINWDRDEFRYSIGISKDYPTMDAGKKDISRILTYHAFKVIGNLYENLDLLETK